MELAIQQDYILSNRSGRRWRSFTGNILQMRQPSFRRLAKYVAVVIPTVLSTCKLDNLFEGGTVGRFAISGDSGEVAVAAVGSTAPRTLTFEISDEGAGALPWTARQALGSAWLSFMPTSGITPDTIVASLDPAGLATGIHQDTIIVIAESGIDSATITVEFTIEPCDEPSIAFDVLVSDSLTREDCATSDSPDRFAKLYGFTGEEGDSETTVYTHGERRTCELTLSGPLGSSGVTFKSNITVLPAPRGAGWAERIGQEHGP